MYTGGDTTHFLRMWLIDSSHWSNGAWMEWERWSIKWEWWSGTVEEYSRAAVTLSSVDRTAITKGFGTTAVADNVTSINNDPWVSEGFFLKVAIVVCPEVAKKIFVWGAKSSEILFYPLKTKQTSFICWKFNRKVSNFKIQGPWPLPAPFRQPRNDHSMHDFAQPIRVKSRYHNRVQAHNCLSTQMCF